MRLLKKSASSKGLLAHEILLTPSIFLMGFKSFTGSKMGGNSKNEVC